MTVADPIPVGTTLRERYRLDSTLGRGAWGVVYRAHDQELNRDVAVKVLSAQALDAENRERMLHEARASAALNHPHIVALYDVGEFEGAPFLVQELVEGTSLRQRPPRDLAEAVAIARQLCDALEHAHARGVVHRDLKPENVLVSDGGDGVVVKLTDLGIARTRHTTRMTAEGQIVGTASYLAPEQALGADVDGRADLYALAVMLYEWATGRLPFVADDPLAVVSQHLHAPVVPPRTHREDVPPALEAIILRGLAKRAPDRFASAHDMEQALAAVDTTGTRLPPTTGGSEESGKLAMLGQLVRGRLVGRHDELEELRKLWRRAMQGQGHLALVSGEPGVGKTRLARELVVVAQLAGAAVLEGGCYEFEATTPYLPFVEALRRWVDSEPVEALRARLGSEASMLARLAPAIDARIGPLTPLPALSAQEERVRLYEAVARLFAGLAAERGVLLFLDDLHWADHGTLALLRYLARPLRDQRILVLGAYREVELDRVHPLSAALDDWNRERLATRIAIGRLSRDDLSRMLATLFSQERVSDDFAEAIYRETEGNPFFAEEVVKALIEQGQIYREGGRWQRGEVADLTIPQSVKAAIGRRLQRLTPETIDVLHTAAALGKVFEWEELAAVATVSEDQILDALDAASTAQLLRSQSDESFVFTHDKIREVLHEEMNPIRRRRLHLRIGQSLEKLHAGDIGEHIEDLAYHFAEAGDLEKGMRYALDAAKSAGAVYAFEEALGHYERARECAEGLEDTDRLGAIEESVGHVHLARGDTMAAAARFERALALAKEPSKRAVIEAWIGTAYAPRGDPRAIPHLEHAMAELDPATQARDLSVAVATIGRYHHYRLEHRRAIEYLERARVLAEPLGDPDLFGMIYSYLAGAYQHMTAFDESDRWAHRSIEVGERTHTPEATALGYEFLAENAANRGAWRDAIRFGDLNRHHGRLAGSLARQAWADWPCALGYFALGEVARAEATMTECLRKAERLSEQRLAAFATSHHVHMLIALGDLERAAADVVVIDRLTRELGQPVLRELALMAIVRLAEIRGAPSGAETEFEECSATLRASDNRIAYVHAGSTLAESLVRSGRAEEGLAIGLDIAARGQDAGSAHYVALAKRAQALALAALGRLDEAATCLDDAVRILDGTGARYELARTLQRMAHLREQRGDREGAREAAERAAALHVGCGTVPDRQIE
jgi:tetratricopeptide (TPR) repeat protein